MKIYQIILASIILFTANYAKASQKTQKCVACVTQAQRDALQRKLDGLRERIRSLEAENEALRTGQSNIAVPSYAPAAAAPRAVIEEPMKKNILSALIGYGPDSVYDRRIEEESGNEVGVVYGPSVGLQYQRIIGETFVLGAGAMVPTYPDTKKPTGLISGGFAW